MDELRRALETCDLCAFIDLDVELVLSCSAHPKPQQEQLDKMAKLASVLLSSSTNTSDSETKGAPKLTTFLTKDRSYFLLSSPVNPSEVIFCRCGPRVDPQSVEAGAQLTLQWIKDAA